MRIRKWYDEDNPDVRFVQKPDDKDFSAITLRDCKGNTVDLLSTILEAYGRGLQRMKETK